MSRWLLALIFFLVASCKTSVSQSTKDAYRDIILDLQVAETIVLNSPVKNKDSLRNLMHQRICEVYGFKTIRELKTKLEPLTSEPELMLEITKSIATKLDNLADSAISAK